MKFQGINRDRLEKGIILSEPKETRLLTLTRLDLPFPERLYEEGYKCQQPDQDVGYEQHPHDVAGAFD